MMFAFMQDEEEGAMEQEQKAFEIYNISEEFVPDINNLKVKYRINDISKIDGIQELRSVKSIQLLALKDDESGNNNDVLYYMDNDILKDTENNTWDAGKYEGEFIWNGHYNTETDKKVTSKDGEIKLVVSCTADGKIIENIPGMSVVINGQEIPYSNVHDGEFTLTDDIVVSVDPTREEWELYNNDNAMEGADFPRYKERRIQYVDRLEELGVDTEETNPIQYLNEHLVAGDFLGQEIPSINIRFLYFLRKLEEELGRSKAWTSNSVQFNRYVSLMENHTIDDYARMSSVNTKKGPVLSDHGTGFAFDIDKIYNPWLGSENVQQDKLIQVVTGKKMLNKQYLVVSSNGADEIKQASDDFLERIGGNDFDIEQESILDTIFTRINKYAGKVTLIEEDKSQDFNIVVTGLVSTLQENITSQVNITPNELIIQKQSLEEATISTITILEGAIRDLDKLKILFDASKDGLFINYDMGNNYEQLYSFITDYKTKSNSIITYLEGVANLPTTAGTAWNEGVNTLKNNLSTISFGSGYQSHLTQFVAKFNEKRKIIGSDLLGFPTALKTETDQKSKSSIYGYMGGLLFEKGFCNLEPELVKAMIQTNVSINGVSMKLLWGGVYKGTKDIMHFELRKNPGSDRQYQKITHEIEMQDIKDYLNSFTNKNGGSYDY